ncbi:MAG: type II toxin-antitoxin system RelE/ParE family toxin [Pseudomonadota bacterium]
MTSAIFLPPARQELNEAIAFYESKSSGLGISLSEEVEAYVQKLDQFPLTGQRLRGPLRRMLLSRFPYQLIYRIERSQLIVLALAHQKQKPGYWQRREKQ